jgi:hypothetical protein
MTIICLATLEDELYFSRSSVHEINSNLELLLSYSQVLNLDAQTYIRLHYDSKGPSYAMGLT